MINVSCRAVGLCGGRDHRPARKPIQTIGRLCTRRCPILYIGTVTKLPRSSDPRCASRIGCTNQVSSTKGHRRRALFGGKSFSNRLPIWRQQRVAIMICSPCSSAPLSMKAQTSCQKGNCGKGFYKTISLCNV